MNLRVSRSFFEGMRCPRRIFSNEATPYTKVVNNSTEIAWKRTGNYIKRSIAKHERNECQRYDRNRRINSR